MNIQFIDLQTQYRALYPQIQARINRALEHGQFILGPEVKELEDKLATYTGSRYCITVSSGTEALLISLIALGVGSGDEVITTPFTFIATAEVIVRVGATPIFVDIQTDTCNLDPNKVESAISSKTKAIIPVSLYGQPADMDEINAVAVKYGNIPVIEDAAQSFGSEYRGRKSCNLSTIGCTSFFPSKPLGCYGDGGAIFTSDDQIAQACREIRVHGQSERYVHSRIGVGGRMDTLQAAIVLAKLYRFGWEVEQRHRIGSQYNELCDNNNIECVRIRDDRTSVFSQYTIFVDDRDAIREKLGKSGVPTAVHYPMPINDQAAYSQYRVQHTPNARQVATKVLSLPMHPDLSVYEQELIISALS
ncbi:MAG: aminotransferase DegT [Spirochaetales bacterium]|jgi:UDP-2-acetamido-2-deoxy-ribo-hexuluronate aminotransferase|nr:aminotransferase DegT [Spirochaetales bacterium]|tara:strand:+ start:1604 stop:2689 length:1086 start_codon:yes stop_codon:yes gene_type:complete